MNAQSSFASNWRFNVMISDNVFFLKMFLLFFCWFVDYYSERNRWNAKDIYLTLDHFFPTVGLVNKNAAYLSKWIDKTLIELLRKGHRRIRVEVCHPPQFHWKWARMIPDGVLHVIDGTGTGDRPFRSGPVRYRSGFRTGRSAVRPVIRRSTGRLPFDRSDR